MRLLDSTGRPIVVGRLLGEGGEGSVYETASHVGFVLKVYRPGGTVAERRAKVESMVANPPGDPSRTIGHASMAWPRALALDDKARFVGFLMDRVDLEGIQTLFRIYHPRRKPAHFTWKKMLRVARNLSAVVASLHQKGYVLGDINDENILVKPNALVTLVDCDSMQVQDPRSGAIYRSQVGVDEYTPREILAQASFANVNRTPSTDNFSLAILVFKLLVDGVHPFAGGPNPTIAENIAAGASFVIDDRHAQPSALVPASILPTELRDMFVRCFRDGHDLPNRRPSASDFVQALASAELSLLSCPRVSTHTYGRHLGECPWCRYLRLHGRDIFPVRRE